MAEIVSMNGTVRTDDQPITMTVRAFLTGAVGNIPVSDSTLKACLYRGNALTYEVDEVDTGGEVVTVTEHTTFNTDWSLLSEKQQDLTLAHLYATVGRMSAVSQGAQDKDADWEHREYGFSLTNAQREDFKKKADELFAKWGEPLMFDDGWGFVGLGFCNPRTARNYGR